MSDRGAIRGGCAIFASLALWPRVLLWSAPPATQVHPMAEQPQPSDVAALSFEDALEELEGIVKGLESGQSKLDDAIASYERGSLLKAHCETKLREAQARVEKIAKAADGAVAAKPVDLG